MKPTIGRIVLFNPTPGTVLPVTHAALITHVHSDTIVNLAVFDANGNAYTRTSVQLVAPGAPCPEFGSYCQWMPHLVQQASEPERQMTITVSRATADALERIIQTIYQKILD